MQSIRLRRDVRRRIIVGADGFELHEGDVRFEEVRWQEIGEIVAWKRDELTVDTVWMEFHLPADGRFVAVNEDDEGFAKMVREVKRIFPDSLQHWDREIIQPPFAANLTQVYRRPDQPVQS
jgi:hypothetical protein